MGKPASSPADRPLLIANLSGSGTRAAHTHDRAAQGLRFGLRCAIHPKKTASLECIGLEIERDHQRWPRGDALLLLPTAWARQFFQRLSHRAQANALDIEAQAKRRLADKYDAAQERDDVGTVRTFQTGTFGKPLEAFGIFPRSSVQRQFRPGRETRPSPAVGLSRKEIYEARAAGLFLQSARNTNHWTPLLSRRAGRAWPARW